MLDLASHGQSGAVSLGAVAKRQGISEKYLWQVAAGLKTARLVESARGPAGGYRLSKPARVISLHDIVAALDGEADPADHAEPKGADRAAAGVMREAWGEAAAGCRRALRRITLDGLAEKHRTRSQRPVMDFVI